MSLISVYDKPEPCIKYGSPLIVRGEHGQASPWTDMDGHGHGRTDGRPWTARNINKASASRLAPKIGILAISMSPVTLELFFMPSDYCVVLLWWRFFGTFIFDGVRPFQPQVHGL